ncbi:MAG: Hpt domain-containing protein, partial [Bradymonadia bacterium]
MDIALFLQTFFEESRENLELMESNLLALTPGHAADREMVDSIFRAIHSIKGGAATFGFSDMADLSHEGETLLDEVREGNRTIDDAGVSLLLEMVDVIDSQVTAHQDEQPLAPDHSADLIKRLKAYLSGTSGDTAESETPPEVEASTRWSIWFRPLPHMLQTGNDPVRMFRELEALGDLQVESHTEQLPALSDLNPEDCHLAWSLTLSGEAITREQVAEVFDWVEGDCELTITAESDEAETASTLAAAEAMALKTARPGPAKAAKTPSVDTRSIRVDTHKIDTLMNMVGQLVITQSMLSQLGEQ